MVADVPCIQLVQTMRQRQPPILNCLRLPAKAQSGIVMSAKHVMPANQRNVVHACCVVVVVIKISILVVWIRCRRRKLNILGGKETFT
jgi:hypothetical protein